MRTSEGVSCVASLVGSLLVGSPSAAEGHLEAGISAWERRAEEHHGTRARPGPVDEAIAVFTRALRADPDDLAARVGLLQALAFRGEYATFGRRPKVRVFTLGRTVAEEGIDHLTAAFAGDPRPKWNDAEAIDDLRGYLADRPGAVGVYLLGAYHWGLWGRYRGRFAAVRQGVAGRLRDYAAIAIALDPLYANAGPHRLLGRLHHEAPRVPFITGWIDRRIAVAELSRAMELGPDDYLGRLFWIEVVLEHDRPRRDEALARLSQLLVLEPRPETMVEDLDALAKARELAEQVIR